MDRLKQFVFGKPAQPNDETIGTTVQVLEPVHDENPGGEWPPERNVVATLGATNVPTADMIKSLSGTMQECMQIQGAVAVAIVDSASGMVLDKLGGGAGLDLDLAGEGNAEVIRAKMRVKEALGITDHIEDILITLTNQYHLIRVLGSDGNLFVYLVLNRAQANLAMARRTLQKAEEGLVV
jgi:hypothetical protein